MGLSVLDIYPGDFPNVVYGHGKLIIKVDSLDRIAEVREIVLTDGEKKVKLIVEAKVDSVMDNGWQETL